MNVDALPQPIWIDTTAALHQLVVDLSSQPRIAVDTESNSLHAYQEQVCLIQFSIPKGDYLVDPLANIELTQMGSIFANPKIEKVFHAAEYDLICLRRDFDFVFANLFDTMVAARTLGYSEVGLGALLAEKFQIQLVKRHQRANWGIRPLSQELLRYAQLDTHFLLTLRDQFQNELKLKGLWALAQEDFSLACRANGSVEREKCPVWERLDSQGALSPRERTILNELCQCREQLGEQVNRPVFKIVSNETLMMLARATPQTKNDLEQVGLTSRQIERFGMELLAAICRGIEAPIVRRSVSLRPSQAFLVRLDTLRAWRKLTAQRMGVGSDVILPRHFLYAIAERSPKNEKELAAVLEHSPWRMAHFGENILETLRKIHD